MVDFTHKRYVASDRSYYAIIKKEIHALALAREFDAKKIASLDVIVAEITSNLHKYTNGGELLVGYSEEEEYLEIICIDQGPGMSDVGRMIADGYSSTNTLGHGLGSIKRLSDWFDIYTQKDWGTILVSRMYKNASPVEAPRRRNITVRSLVLAKPNEDTSGDGFYMKKDANYIKLMLADGLGHGADANHAVNTAVEAFRSCPYQSPVEIIRYLHPLVRKTRGLVATFVVIDRKAGRVHLAGVGNISTRVMGQISKTHLAYNGIIGHNIPSTMNDQSLDLTQISEIVLCSDGIRSRWDPGRYPGISRCDPIVQAAALYKDFGRQTDDMSVIVAKL